MSLALVKLKTRSLLRQPSHPPPSPTLTLQFVLTPPRPIYKHCRTATEQSIEYLLLQPTESHNGDENENYHVELMMDDLFGEK
jgi:hypothetical protein